VLQVFQGGVEPDRAGAKSGRSGPGVRQVITHLREAAAHHTRYSAHNCKNVTRAIELRYACLEGGKVVKTLRLNHRRAALLAVAAAGLLAAVGVFVVVLYA
jgi:hypothetical protein